MLNRPTFPFGDPMERAVNVAAATAARETAAVWFSRLVWTGIVCNILFALPAIVDPTGSPALPNIIPLYPIFATSSASKSF